MAPPRRALLVALAKPLALALCLLAAAHGQLVGPGALAPRTGGAGRARSFGYVREPALGFFVAGSAIDGVNGVYFRVDPASDPAGHLLGHSFQLLYKSTRSPYLLGLANAPANGAYHPVGGLKTEWVLVDGTADRFAHEGETILPGAGDRWKHVRRPHRHQPGEFQHQHTEQSMDDLPWQVVGIMDSERLNQLYNYQQYHDRVTKSALHAAESQRAALPAGGRSAHAPPTALGELDPLPQAEEARASGDYIGMANALAEDAVVHENEGMRAPPRDAEYALWRAALRRLAAAEAMRRGRDFAQARRYAEWSRSHYFRFDASFVEDGKRAMDMQDYKAAISAFSRTQEINRNYEGLAAWMVRARAAVDRQARLQNEARLAEAGGASIAERETAHCLAWRQTGQCMPHGPREPALDKACDARIEIGNSGYCECKTHGGRIPPQASPATCRGTVAFTCAEACKTAFEARVRAFAEAYADGTVADELRVLASAEEQRVAQAAAASADHRASPSAQIVRELREMQPYAVLGVPCDFTADELKRAFRKESLRLHPDKHGGSTDGFAIVSSAHDTLSDEGRKRALDEGEDLRTDADDADELPPYAQRITKEYFPERFGFHPFGDPFERKRELAKQHAESVRRGEEQAHRLEELASEQEELAAEAERERRLEAMMHEDL